MEEVEDALRAAILRCQELFGQLYSVSVYGFSAVVQAIKEEVNIPGISPDQMKAIKVARVKELQAEADALARLQAERSRIGRERRQLAAATAAVAAVPESESSSSLPKPVSAKAAVADGRSIYPCNACNVLGHWRQDNKCRPADIQANLRRLAALLPASPAGPQLALPAPSPSSSGMIFVFVHCFSLYFPFRGLDLTVLFFYQGSRPGF